MLDLKLLSALVFILDFTVVELPDTTTIGLPELLGQVESLTFIHLTLSHHLLALLLLLLDPVLAFVMLGRDLGDDILILERLLAQHRSCQLDCLH